MNTRAEQYYSTAGLYALLMMHLLTLGSAKCLHRPRHDIQMKNYTHPRFDYRRLCYCAFNKYFDHQEGRCMIVPGGGIAISIKTATCRTETLRGHRNHPRNYCICRKSQTILAKCRNGEHFENSLKRCVIDVSVRADKQEDYDSQQAITEQGLRAPAPELLSIRSGDASNSDIQYTKAQPTTTPRGMLSIDQSSTFIEKLEIKSTPDEMTTFYDAVTLTTPVNSYALNRDESLSSIGPTDIVDSTPVSLTSLTTPRNKEAERIQESRWTNEEDSTIANRYPNTFSLFSTDMSDNENVSLSSLTTPRNKEAERIQESRWTNEEDSTIANRYPNTFSLFSTDMSDNENVSLTSLTTPRNKEAERIQESRWTNEEDSTIANRYPNTFSLFSTDMSDNEKSTTADTELTMSTTESAYISKPIDEDVAHSGFLWLGRSTTDLLTPIEQRQGTTDENAYPGFTETNISTASTAGTTGDSDSGVDVASSATAVTASISSESSQRGDRQVQRSSTISSARNISEYPATIDASVSSTNSLSTTIPFSDSTVDQFWSPSTDGTTTIETEGTPTVQ